MMPRLMIARLMLAVAGLAVILAAFRAHFSLGSLVGGLLSVGSIRLQQWLVTQRTAGRTISRVEWITEFGWAVGFAAVRLALIGGATVLVFFMISPELFNLIFAGERLHCRLSDQSVVFHSVVGTVLGWGCYRLLRWLICSPAAKNPPTGTPPGPDGGRS